MDVQGIRLPKFSAFSASKLEPEQSANSLFHFVEKYSYLEGILRKKLLPLWYVEEDMRYLQLPQIPKVIIPMKCFCDINLHKIQPHMEYYGYYGVAFSKEWGVNKSIQPVHYINNQSDLAKQYKTSLLASLNAENNADKNLKNYLASHMMYIKPISGFQKKIGKSKPTMKYFLDEAEWRYIFDISKFDIEGCKQLYVGENNDNCSEFNKGLLSLNKGLYFEYSDLKYIIVNSENDYSELIKLIDDLDLDRFEKYMLSSKILVWENSRRDF